jgi:hypothetical protein
MDGTRSGLICRQNKNETIFLTGAKTLLGFRGKRNVRLEESPNVHEHSDSRYEHKTIGGGANMAKYGKKASKKVEKAMHERKKGTLKSGRSGKKVTSKKQAIAIGLSQARKEGAKVPRKKSSSKKK